MLRSVVCGVGAALPENVVTNKDLELKIDTSHEWIVQRTGIEQRYISMDHETTVSLGTKAALDALAHAEMDPQDLDLIILATSTPNHTFPASATEIQHNLNMKHGFAFDIQAVCSGFIFALSTADTYIRSKAVKTVMVIGADTFSKIVDWNDRRTCVLFGDGAGAVILKAQEFEETQEEPVKLPGIVNFCLRSDGQHKDKLYVDGGPSTTKSTGYLRMEGKEVFKHAVGMITDVIFKCFEQANISSKDLDWFVPHQANKRIIESSAKKIGLTQDQVIITVHQHGNTSAASVPLALNHAVKNGKIKKGDLIMLEAMGSGFTWGAMLIRW